MHRGIKEVLLRRYNLIRQAVEIYFKNNKSVLISFFKRDKKSEFIEKLHDIKKKWREIEKSGKEIDKNLIPDFTIEKHPERKFTELKFKEVSE